ncbi:hypothetical protein PORY_001726 [Pneumocystis oryctolagi]|uniref:Uncharacterized protein n=1 Tax=Pneumocystis oryctolagi TaxID=42067 RepID=A0ACB7CBX3_9ASCO|nr:hypothetical protein PORY_001726 [Pneumocystis oryctolagi]
MNKMKTNEKIKSEATFLNLFDFTKKKDIFLLFSACIISVINGLFAPYMTFLLGRLFHVFSLISLKQITEKEFEKQVNHYILSFTILTAVSFIGGWLFQTLWYIFAETQVIRVNRQLFYNFASKEIKWYDLRHKSIAGIINRCEKNIGSFHYVFSNTLGKILSSITTCIVSLFLAFWYSWKLTLVILVSLPIVVLIATITSYFIQPSICREKDAISQAVTLVDQAIVNIPIVKVFNGQQYESSKFHNSILKSTRISHYWKRIYALQQSLVRFVILAMFVQGFWYGSHLVITKKISVGNVVTVFWACLMVSFSIQTIIQYLVSVDHGKISSYDLQSLFKEEKIQEKDHKSHNFFSPEKCYGNVIYDSVSFAYPSRPEKMILKDISLFFPGGKTTFVIGSSGSGKSTLAALLIRIYEIDSGSIYIDNENIKSLDINWIRNNVTLAQQPVIFNETLKLNIAIGKSSSNSVDTPGIKNASRMAMLEEMIFELPDGYDTKLGINGLLLSGGQMQRVEIARARFRDTPILILDESTNSLDYINRSLIHDAVRFWRKDKTTIIITHDIDQIEESDYVYIINDGRVVQKGFKKELLEDKDGIFFDAFSRNEKTKNLLSFQKQIDHSFEEKSNDYIVNPCLDNKAYRKSSVFGFLKTNLSIEALLNSANVTIKNRRNANIQTSTVSPKTEDSVIQKISFRKKYFLLNISLWNLLKENYKYINKKAFLILGVFFSIGNGVATPLFSYTLAKLLSLFFSLENTSKIAKKSLESSMIVLGVSLFDSLTLYLKIYFFELSSNHMVTNIRSKLYKNVLFQDMFYFSEKKYSNKNITRIIINETESMKSIFGGILGNILVAIVIASIGIIWSFIIAWKLTIITVSMLPLLYISTRYYSYINNIWEQKYKDEKINASFILHEFTENTFTVKALLLNNFFEEKYMLSIEKIFMKGVRRAIYIGFGYGFMESVIFSFKSSTLLFFCGSKFILKKVYTPITILTVFTLIMFSIITASQFLSVIPHYNKIKNASDEVNTLFNVSRKNTENKGSLIVPLNGEIIFKNVTFSYPGHSNKVLQNINLEIKNHEKIALVGLSGSGKSTIISLIQKLYQIQEGVITINGYDISSIEVKWLRNHIAVVRQTPMLFNMTIEQNISYALNSFDKSDVRKAAQKANIDDFIMKLPDGYNTMLGDYGKGLSSGQAQRISLARAFIRNPKILILDECTNALDPPCASSIQKIIKDITNITVIIITHSKDMMKIADRIVLLKNGQITETGTYDELMNIKKDFWTLIQKGDWS